MLPLIFLVLFLPYAAAAESESEETSEREKSELEKMMPSAGAFEEVGVRLLDALIKRGQMEMAKGAFKTQMEVLRKVQPEQYKKYKKIPIDQLAAQAVLEQAEMSKMMPKTGNRFVDMLHENGIPIGSSIKGIQQAIKTQREMEENDPAEQILKAVLEKFQKQILPGIVANAIAGRNPFEVPPRQQIQEMVDKGKQEQMARQGDRDPQATFYAPSQEDNQRISQATAYANSQMSQAMMRDESSPQRRQSSKKPVYRGSLLSKQNSLLEDRPSTEDGPVPNDLFHRIKNSPRLSAIYQQINNGERHAEDDGEDPQKYRLSDIPISPQREPRKGGGPRPALTLKEALLFGAIDSGNAGNEEEDEDKDEPRRSPLRSTDFERRLRNSPKLSKLLDSEQLEYQLNSPDKYLGPKKIYNNPNPQPGYATPRPIPKRPRAMLPLVIGVRPEATPEAIETEKTPREPFSKVRRSQPNEPVFDRESNVQSRVLERLRNNPALAQIFEDDELIEHLGRNSVLTEEQKGRTGDRGRLITTYPNRAAGVKTHTGAVLKSEPEVRQDIEERPIPPLLFKPKGKHTRLRFVGAVEKEIPGLGSRFIIPSLDPTMPAINSAMQMQGKMRDEYDTMFKVPNDLNAGGTFGIHSKSRSERFYGADGMADAPALGPISIPRP